MDSALQSGLPAGAVFSYQFEEGVAFRGLLVLGCAVRGRFNGTKGRTGEDSEDFSSLELVPESQFFILSCLSKKQNESGTEAGVMAVLEYCRYSWDDTRNQTSFNTGTQTQLLANREATGIMMRVVDIWRAPPIW